MTSVKSSAIRAQHEHNPSPPLQSQRIGTSLWVAANLAVAFCKTLLAFSDSKGVCGGGRDFAGTLGNGARNAANDGADWLQPGLESFAERVANGGQQAWMVLAMSRAMVCRESSKLTPVGIRHNLVVCSSHVGLV